ncbi:hypothetical protein [Antribacter gilvus]|uniref:hypothetical protein n=1 Tax=Antribacter gilvus TaxID=2304675 RepID=UPI000F7AFCE6|nr:hypothetical protein [Antribacter gilvus]
MPEDNPTTVTFALEPQADGYPALVDDELRAALASAVRGGEHTQGYFDALNATSDFWGLVAAKTITFAPGVAPSGQPVLMASSGNVELRMIGAYTGPPDGVGPQDHPVVGTLTIDTRNTTASISKVFAVGVRLATMPAYLPLTHDLFVKLLVPTYQNAKSVLGALAAKISKAAQVESPSIDPTAAADEVILEEEGALETVGEEGIEYLAVEWGAVALDVAGIAPLMALPMLVEFLGHKMQHSLVVQNLTGQQLTLDLALVHGDQACAPASTTLPGLSTQDDPINPGSTVTYSYDAYFQLINSTDLGDIGHVLTLTPSDGGAQVRVVTAVPWAGDNAIWVGESDLPARSLYAQRSVPNEHLTQTASVGNLKVTHSINRLSGTTDGDYFYCSMVLIEPA